MKIKYLILVFIGFVTRLHAEIINFPDLNFKNRLLQSTANVGPIYFIASDVSGNNMAVDANQNGEIEVSEAQAVYMLTVQGRNITDLTAIEYFTNLIDLNCADNQLTTLDVSTLTNLQIFRCDRNDIGDLNIDGLFELRSLAYSGNNLPNLNVNPFTNLAFLYCDNNQITNLDLSGLPSISFLVCDHNNIQSLNLSNQINLRSLYCDYNLLTNLDVSTMLMVSLHCNNNPLVNLNMKTGNFFGNNLLSQTNMNFSNCPTLTSICVDDFNINSIQNKVNGYGYVNCSVNSNCNLSSVSFDFNQNIKIFPNPVSNTLNIEYDKQDMSTITISNVSGQTILTLNVGQHSNAIDVSELTQGVYFIKMITDQGTMSDKFIKQ